MISDPVLFVECDNCGERVDFSFSLVLGKDWLQDEKFNGWIIDWEKKGQGDALCPVCSKERDD